MCWGCFSSKADFSTLPAICSSRSVLFPSAGPILCSGHLRMFKTLKKKYFILRGEAPGYPACLEYYDSKQKFINKETPKYRIFLHDCFSINKYSDTRQKYCIALNMMDDCFCFVLKNEKELEDWLNSMLLLKNGEPRSTYEHVWQVNIQKKELGSNIHGPYRLCLTNEAVTFVKLGAKYKSEFIKVPLQFIKRCGFRDRVFYMEMGRMAITGAGDFWMETKEKNMAFNMCVTIMNFMTNLNCKKERIEFRRRMRSSSKDENLCSNTHSNSSPYKKKASYLSLLDFSEDRN